MNRAAAMTTRTRMILNTMPTKGMALPFFSYGGSSLWGFTLLLFIFLILLLVVCTAFLVTQNYNPFLYFRF